MQQLAVRVACRLGQLGGRGAGQAVRRLVPGELGGQVLVLQQALPGRPVPGQQRGHRQQQVRARHLGPLGQMGQPAPQQRHPGRRRVRPGVRVLRRAPEPGGPPEQCQVPHRTDVRDDQLRCVQAQLTGGQGLLAGGRVLLGALDQLDRLGERVQVRQQVVGQRGQELGPPLPVERLRHDVQPGLGPVGAEQHGQRRAVLGRRGERDQHHRPVREVAVAHGGQRLGVAAADRLQPGQRGQQAHPAAPVGAAGAAVPASASARSTAAYRSRAAAGSSPAGSSPAGPASVAGHSPRRRPSVPPPPCAGRPDPP